MNVCEAFTPCLPCCASRPLVFAASSLCASSWMSVATLPSYATSRYVHEGWRSGDNRLASTPPTLPHPEQLRGTPLTRPPVCAVPTITASPPTMHTYME